MEIQASPVAGFGVLLVVGRQARTIKTNYRDARRFLIRRFLRGESWSMRVSKARGSVAARVRDWRFGGPKENITSALLYRPPRCGRVAEWRSPHASWRMSACDDHCRLRRLLTIAGPLHATPLLPFPAGTVQALSVSGPRKCLSCEHHGYF